MKQNRIIVAVLLLIAIALIAVFLNQPRLKPPGPAPLSDTNEPSANSSATDLSVTPMVQPGNAPIAPSAATNGVDPRRGELIRHYIEQLRADPNYQFKVPIFFYGKVLDQDEKPVVGADVSFKWNKLNDSSTGIESGVATTKTAESGLFSLEGQTGNQLSVSISKSGYYNESINPSSFEYADPSSGAFYSPDAKKPVVFHLKARGIAEPLITGEKLFGFKPNGTQYYINLMNGKKSADPSGDWDVSVRVTRSLPNADRKFDWSVVFDASNGGLIESNGQFAFWAPESGYQPVNIIQNASDPTWQSGEKVQFFVKSRDGKVYARIETSITPDYNEDAAISMKYFVNPSGSRNLEFDPNNVIPPDQ